MVNQIGPLEKGQSFNEWCRLYDNFNQFLHDPPIFCKMIHHQLFEVINNIPKENRYKPGFYSNKYDEKVLKNFSEKYNSEYFKRILFPDLKFIKLKRDVIKNAVSLYCSRITQKYHIYDEESLLKYKNMNIEINENKLIESFIDAKNNEKIWDSFGAHAECILISYDDLINNTEITLNDIFTYLNISVSSKDVIKKTKDKSRIFKMTRDDFGHIEEKLRQLLKNKIL